MTERLRLSPVEREARQLAREVLKHHLRKEGNRLIDINSRKFQECNEEFASAPYIHEAAKQAVDNRERLKESEEASEAARRLIRECERAPAPRPTRRANKTSLGVIKTEDKQELIRRLARNTRKLAQEDLSQLSDDEVYRKFSDVIGND